LNVIYKILAANGGFFGIQFYLNRTERGFQLYHIHSSLNQSVAKRKFILALKLKHQTNGKRPNYGQVCKISSHSYQFYCQ